MVAMNATSDADDPYEPRPRDGLRGWIPQILGIAAFLAMVIFWIYAFSNTDSVAHKDEFTDPEFASAATAICSERQAAIAELPLATSVNDPLERADLVALGTHQLEQMVADLGELTPPADPEAAEGVSKWLTDYERYLQDRRNYSELLSTGEDPAFVISQSESRPGVRVTDLLTTFAEVNDMLPCGPSGDV
jgi:hypothetical protein